MASLITRERMFLLQHVESDLTVRTVCACRRLLRESICGWLSGRAPEMARP